MDHPIPWRLQEPYWSDWEPQALFEELCDSRAVISRRIALVDDEFLVRATIAEALEEAGYRVIAFDGPAAALQWLRAGNRADLLVTDIRMPGMSGLALAHDAKALDSSLEVLLVSGYADELPILDLRRIPLLMKPFRTEQLVVEVDRLMQHRQEPQWSHVARPDRGCEEIATNT